MAYSFKFFAFLLLSNILSISTATRTIEPECHSCSHPGPTVPVLPIPPVTGIVPVLPIPPVTGIVPVLPIPPVTGIVPVLPIPPVTGIVPPVIGIIPPVTGIVPPVTGGVIPTLPVPPVTGGIVPPVTGVIPKIPVIGIVPLPPVILPPVVTTTPKKGKPCAPTAHNKASCPLNTLKLSVCASVLGGSASNVIGYHAYNKCCPVISGLLDVEAAACLCTTLKIKALNLKIYVPIALQLLITCGKTPPAGYTCPV